MLHLLTSYYFTLAKFPGYCTLEKHSEICTYHPYPVTSGAGSTTQGQSHGYKTLPLVLG